MKDRGEPQSYQFRHPKRISLDNYRGIASDIMTLNDPVADGFMRVSDIRADVVVTKKPQERIRDYEDLGTVRISKMLKLPRLDAWKKTGQREVRREDDAWVVAIDDQTIADEVIRSSNKREFDASFVKRFQREVNKGLKDCLKNEKLLDGGKYNLFFLSNYSLFLCFDAMVIPAYFSSALSSPDTNLAFLLVKTIVLYGSAHATSNSLPWIVIGMDKIHELARKIQEQELGPSPYNFQYPDVNSQEPFIRHSLPEFIMPPVPVDRLLRGIVYLKKHGDKLIQPRVAFNSQRSNNP